MIYIIAAVLGLAACVQGFLSEITRCNIIHLRNGRPPNAGAALIPSIPFLPLTFVGVAWLLRVFVQEYAKWILIAVFITLSLLWLSSFVKLRVELRQVEANLTNDHST